MSQKETFFFTALMGGLVACLILSGLYVWKAPHRVQVAKVDIQSLIKQQAGYLSEQHLSQTEEQAALTGVMMQLKKTLADQDPSVILLDASVVLSAQVPDMTENIRQQLRNLGQTQPKGNQP